MIMIRITITTITFTTIITITFTTITTLTLTTITTIFTTITLTTIPTITTITLTTIPTITFITFTTIIVTMHPPLLLCLESILLEILAKVLPFSGQSGHMAQDGESRQHDMARIPEKPPRSFGWQAVAIRGNALGGTEPSDPQSLLCSPLLPSEVTVIVTATQSGNVTEGKALALCHPQL
ncbi:Tubulin Monoglycylase Ttll3 [Manis pentadactyla]|nr:Tubulin Monoglycylase Ttll3 [Manis pentadactyla]